jgi:eukaryotic-like serine/threonine-protein kinase
MHSGRWKLTAVRLTAPLCRSRVGEVLDSLPRFGRYEALFKIASGGMAEVFAARIRGEAGFEKLVAVKRMLPHLAEDPGFVDMFLDEARVAVHVSSPHVVQTLDLGRADDGALYIVMELVVGSALSTLVRDLRRADGRVPIPIAVELIAQAAQGLDDAHEAVTPTGVHLNIVHRDVSPHNVLVGADGRARVTDFGIARAMMRRTATAAGELKGKFAYFSPEQASGQPLDRRADIFALGIVGWEALLGRRLFTGDDPMSLLQAVKSEPIPLACEVDDEVPLAVARAIAKALQRDPSKRYQTAAEMAHALREAGRTIGPQPSSREIGRWVGEHGGESLQRVRRLIDQSLNTRNDEDALTLARPSQPRVKTPELATSNITVVPIEHTGTVNATTTTTATTEQIRGRSRAPLVIAGLLVAGLAGGGVYLAMRKEPEPAPAATVAPLPSTTVTTTPVVDAAPPPTAEPSHSSAKQPAKWVKPGTKQPTKPTVTSEPVVTAPPPPPATTSATPPPKKPTGPILGDEAFDKK